ncbi:MAG TPA: alpha/beta hydrolase [Kofleriaceae bacterium]|nr:alpha/beta hydrolase [Kofleriaceae bacterium]
MFRWLGQVIIIAAACGNSPRQAPPPTVEAAPIAAPAPYRPTSFSVDVAGHGRAVILIPGLGCPGSVWDDTVAHFGGRVETHVLTLAGFAGRPPITAPLLATARDELAHYIRDRKLEHPIVIGHSLGGFLAYWLAETDPDLVDRLIVVDAAPAISGEIKPGSQKSLTDGWRNDSDADFARETRLFFSSMGDNKAKLEPVIVAVARSDKRTFADAVDDLNAIDIRPDLGNIRASTLVVLAEDDTYPGVVAAQIAAIPRHQQVTLMNTKHFVFFDDPAAFFRAVDDFLTH